MNTFVERFSSSQKIERGSEYLNTIMQGSSETLIEYIVYFNNEKMALTNPNMVTVINAFSHWATLWFGSMQRDNKVSVQKFEYVLAKVCARIRWDEIETYWLSMGLLVSP